MRVLLVKMSSLGDVVHALPAVTDAARHGIRFDWVVEEAFAAIPALHPAVERVVPIAWRRWRHRLGSERAALAEFFTHLRAIRYDLVIDAQGLAKSAVVTRAARARARAGFGFGSAREGIAALAYGTRVAVPRDRHAIDRLRALFAGVFGYPAPEADAPLDYGVRAGAERVRRCVLLHGTTWASKHWPDAFWRVLAQEARAAGHEIALPAGNAAETARANAIAGPVGGAVWSGMGLTDLIPLLGQSALAIGVDSGLTHLAAALDVPTLALYGSTDSALTGCRGRHARSVQAEFPCVPCRARECAYRGPAQAWSGITVEPACYASLPPERVWAWARELAAPGRP